MHDGLLLVYLSHGVHDVIDLFVDGFGFLRVGFHGSFDIVNSSGQVNNGHIVNGFTGSGHVLGVDVVLTVSHPFEDFRSLGVGGDLHARRSGEVSLGGESDSGDGGGGKGNGNNGVHGCLLKF